MELIKSIAPALLFHQRWNADRVPGRNADQEVGASLADKVQNENQFARCNNQKKRNESKPSGSFCTVPYRKGNMKSFRDKNGHILEGSISEKIHVNINSTTLGMFIVGKDTRKPILLFLGGGPGIPEYFLETGGHLNRSVSETAVDGGEAPPELPSIRAGIDTVEGFTSPD